MNTFYTVAKRSIPSRIVAAESSDPIRDDAVVSTSSQVAVSVPGRTAGSNSGFKAPALGLLCVALLVGCRTGQESIYFVNEPWEFGNPMVWYEVHPLVGKPYRVQFSVKSSPQPQTPTAGQPCVKATPGKTEKGAQK